jgi:hypothetical protein
MLVCAVGWRDMSISICGWQLNRTHDFELVQADVALVCRTIRTMGVEISRPQ